MRVKVGKPAGKPKSGGRQKGVPNKASAERQKQVAESGITPLDYMLKVLRSPDSDNAAKAWAAEKAAPYCHPKLATVEHTGKGGGPIQSAVTVRFVKPPPT